MRDLVVLIPGILGSVLRHDGDVAWGYSAGSIGSALVSRGASLRKALSLHGDDPTLDDLGDGVTVDGLMPDLHLLPGFWKIDGYTAVARRLREHFALIPGQNFFEFAYDWRRHNTVSARRLGEVTRTWLKAWRDNGNPDARVIYLAHSMGGLVARQYLEVLGGWEDGSVRALITFGTPFRGSLNALRTLANGMQVGPLRLSALSEFCRTCTSIYQLLPIFPAYDAGDGKLARVAAAGDIPNVDPQRAREALAFHDALRDAVRRNRLDPRWDEKGYTTFPIVGRAQPTDYVGTLDGGTMVMSRLYRGKDLGGDGTVPYVSAIPEEFDDLGQRADMYAALTHGSLQNGEAVLDHVIGRIDDFYTDFGGFKGRPESLDATALEVADLVRSDEPVRVRARPQTPQPLRFSLFGSRDAAPLRVIDVPRREDEWVEVQFEPLPEGVYRVAVATDRSSIEEALAVADARVLDESEAGT